MKKAASIRPVIAAAPGGGVPGGTVVYFRKGQSIKARTLQDGVAVLAMKPSQAFRKPFTVQYAGDGSYQASTSAPLRITNRGEGAKGRG